MELETRLTINNEYVAAESDSDEEADENKTIKAVIDSRSAREKANVLSRLAFCWLSPMFKTGYKKQIEVEDLQYLEDQCKSSNTLKKFNENWDKYYSSQQISADNQISNGMEQRLISLDEYNECDLDNDDQESAAKQQKEDERLKLWRILLGMFST